MTHPSLPLAILFLSLSFFPTRYPTPTPVSCRATSTLYHPRRKLSWLEVLRRCFKGSLRAMDKEVQPVHMSAASLLSSNGSRPCTNSYCDGSAARIRVTIAFFMRSQAWLRSIGLGAGGGGGGGSSRPGAIPPPTVDASGTHSDSFELSWRWSDSAAAAGYESFELRWREANSVHATVAQDRAGGDGSILQGL